MTSRERMLAAMDGRTVDRIPIAPYFWGGEYSWRLTGRPLWQVLYGTGDMGLELLQAIDARHAPDWVLPTHASNGMLANLSWCGEDSRHVRFSDQEGRTYLFHKQGHWLLPEADVSTTRLSHHAAETDPPETFEQADSWLHRYFPHRDVKSDEVQSLDRSLRLRFPDRLLCCVATPPFASLAYSLGFEPTLALLHSCPSVCAYMIERILGDQHEEMRRRASEGYDAVLMVDSWASADIMSPRCYADWIAPLHRLIAEAAHAAGMRAIMYNTGNVLPMMPVMSRLGYDAISCEERIKGVDLDLEALYAASGDGCCLFGNFDAYLLLRGGRAAIAQEVSRMRNAAAGRQFIMGTGSPICDETDPEIIDWWMSLVRERFA